MGGRRGLQVDALAEDDRPWAAALIAEHFSSTRLVSRGRLLDATTLPGLVARRSGRRAGLLHYRIDERGCEVVALASEPPGTGAGSALLEAVADHARGRGCPTVWLITTNDNVRALRFYQRRGFRLVALHAGALEESRRLQPGIPLLGADDIPLRDELELELVLWDQGGPTQGVA